MRLWCSRPHRASAAICRRMQRPSLNPGVWQLVSMPPFKHQALTSRLHCWPTCTQMCRAKCSLWVRAGYDGRHKSREFAKLAAAVFVSQGVNVHRFSQEVPTPFVAGAVTYKVSSTNDSSCLKMHCVISNVVSTGASVGLAPTTGC